MPLKKGKSSGVISGNIAEMRRNPSAKTKRAAATYAKKHGVSMKTALGKIAAAAAYNKAGKSRKKKSKKK